MIDRNIDMVKPVVNSCNSGVTACLADLALQILGSKQSHLYDGSWSEYGSIEEPDFHHGTKHGTWNEPHNETVERMLKSKGKWEEYVEKRNFTTKLKQQEHDRR